jgi:hypothetical protein
VRDMLRFSTLVATNRAFEKSDLDDGIHTLKTL